MISVNTSQNENAQMHKIPIRIDSAACQRNFMKGEFYICVEKSSPTPLSTNFYFYKTNNSQYYTKGSLMYSITYNRFHEAIVYDENHIAIGKIRGRGYDWNYEGNNDKINNMNVILSYFPSLDSNICDLKIKLENNNKYKLDKPKPRGWSKFVLDFEHLNNILVPSIYNFKVVSDNDDENLVMISGKLKKRNFIEHTKYHIITNMNSLQASLIFFFKHLGK